MNRVSGVRRRMVGFEAATVLLCLASACTSPSVPPRHSQASNAAVAQGDPRSGAPTRSRAPAHIVEIVLENEEYPNVIGPRRAPFLNSLARHGVLLTDAFAVSHPSLPNYLALTSGSSFGITSDCTGCYLAGPDIVDQLVAHHMSWKAYMQGLPSPCFKGDQAGSFPHQYAAKHDPFIHYVDIRSSPGLCRRIVPFTRLGADLRHNVLPRFSFISPDECFDMHSCPTGIGDAWLAAWVPRILRELGSNGLLVVVFDEGTSGAGCCGPGIAGGHVAAVIAGPGARQGVRIATPLDHYSILRLIEDVWGFRRLGHAADPSTGSIAAALRR